jgi:prepilin-type N-terminal cleavage/methylation domain-containing protein
MRRRSQRQGFTLVEVMVSLGVMTIGAMAILALQQQIIRANVHARQLTTATQIAQNVIERLKLDGVAWNTPGVPGNQTQYLRNVTAGAIGTFQTLPFVAQASGGVTRIQSNAFDYYGDDINTQAGPPANLYYCASYRLTFVYQTNRIIRADVRVWWAREGEAAIRTDFPLCADDNIALNPGGTAFNNYHVVYLSTVLRAE